MSKATRGPWEIGQYPWLIQMAGDDSADGEVAQANSHRVKEYEANARLIAAAPDLLETLERAIQWLRRLEQEYPGCLNDDAIAKHLEPAIAKATGQ